MKRNDIPGVEYPYERRGRVRRNYQQFFDAPYCLTVAIIFWFQRDRKVEANATGEQGRGSQVVTLAVYNFVRIRLQVGTLYVGRIFCWSPSCF